MSHGFQSLFGGILFALVFVTDVFARDNDLRLNPGTNQRRETAKMLTQRVGRTNSRFLIWYIKFNCPVF